MESITVRLDGLPLGRFHWRVSLVGGVGAALRATNISMVTFVLASLVEEWNLSPADVGNIGSVGIIGMVIGVAVTGNLADHYGRKAMFQATLLIFSIGSALSGMAWNVTSLMITRLFTGIGLGGGSPVIVTLISELSPSRYRGRMLLLLETFWVLGGALAAVLAYAVIPQWGWRMAFFVGALPILYTFVVAKMLPESPRYLLGRGRVAQAERIVEEAEASCGVQTASEIANGGIRRVRPERRSRIGLDELWSKRYMKRTICLWILWFTVAYVYYGVFVWLPTLLRASGFTLVNSLEYMVIILMAQLPGCLAAAALIDKIGRKWTLAPFMFLCGIATYLFGLAKTTETILLWGSMIAFFNLGAWGTMTAFTAEMYPTRLRSTGVGWANAFGRVGGIIAPSVTGVILGQWNGNYELVFVTFAAMTIVGGLNVALLGEETVGRSLEELAS